LSRDRQDWSEKQALTKQFAISAWGRLFVGRSDSLEYRDLGALETLQVLAESRPLSAGEPEMAGRGGYPRIRFGRSKYPR
jgi:hypothetical protein